MYQTHVFTTTLIFLAGSILSACKPSASHQDVARAQMQYDLLPTSIENGDEITIVQNDSKSMELDALKIKFEEQYKVNQIRISELKVKMKRIATLEQTNRKLKASIETYQQGQVDWELFKRAFNHDMNALGKELKDLSAPDKK